MKIFVRICLALCALLVITAAAGYFIVTRPAFQKKLTESFLPEGSSIRSIQIQITTGTIRLTDLKLRLANGTSVKLDSFHSGFSPLAAVFDRTLRLRGVNVDGLVVKLPETPAAAPESGASGQGEVTTQTQSAKQTSGPAPDPAPAWSADALYALDENAWLLDIDSIQLNAELIDGSINRYVFDLESGPITPGEETTFAAEFKLESQETLQGGLKDFNSALRVTFTQKTTGGLEQLRVESLIEGSDEAGNSLLSVSQSLEFSVDSSEKSAVFDLSFQADLPNPKVFAPELAALQGLALQCEMKGSAQGNTLTLLTADLDAASNGAPVASLKLKQSLTVGGEMQFSGELMEVNLSDLPIAWVNFWLGEELRLSGQTLSAQIVVSATHDGEVELRALAPIQIGPLSLTRDEEALLREVTLRVNPVVRMEADRTLHYDLGDVEVLDRYGAFLKGTVSGSMKKLSGEYPLQGLQTQLKLELGLAELLRQPMLENKASVMAGQARVQLDIDGAAEYPARLQAVLTGLRARDLPGSRQDYRLATQLQLAESGGYVLGGNFAAGSENRPSTNIQLAGQVNPDAQPMPFKLDLTAPRISQSDFDLLIAAAKPKEVAAAPTTPRRGDSHSDTSPAAPVDVPAQPQWAHLNGQATIQVDELILSSGQQIQDLNFRAIISQPLLALRDITARMKEGRLGGDFDIAYDTSLKSPYQMAAQLNFEEVDPSVFSPRASGSFPVKGRFDGLFNMTGSGKTLEDAFENSEAAFSLIGRDGVFTAFDLDSRSQLGLLGAGLLGQSLNRPGMAALAQAIPYFKDMQFDKFTLELVRTKDKEVLIPELSFQGEHLSIHGEGLIAASTLYDVLEQPLDLNLSLGAKGRLIDYLETLGLLQSELGVDGFRAWEQEIRIGGSLVDPDVSALREILNKAARRVFKEPAKTEPAKVPSSQSNELPSAGLDALSPDQKKNTEPPVNAPANEPKEKKPMNDIEMGLDLLNSLLG